MLLEDFIDYALSSSTAGKLGSLIFLKSVSNVVSTFKHTYININKHKYIYLVLLFLVLFGFPANKEQSDTK